LFNDFKYTYTFSKRTLEYVKSFSHFTYLLACASKMCMCTQNRFGVYVQHV